MWFVRAFLRSEETISADSRGSAKSLLLPAVVELQRPIKPFVLTDFPT